MNQFESAAFSRALEAAGYVLVPKGEPADLTLLNSCTVTHRADMEVRNLIRRAYRANPDGRTVVTGCYAQLRPEELAKLPGVVLVAGNDEKASLVDRIVGLPPDARPEIHVSPPGRDGRVPDLDFPTFDRTRAFFRVQDGCSAACAYCAVPRARGPNRSLPLDRVLEGLDRYARAGYEEVVLTGIHLGAWGQDLLPPDDFAGLLKALIREPAGPRLRISSIEPNEVTGDVIRMVRESGRICPHLHLPLQSGSDGVLARMGRPYDAAFFKDLIASLADGFPDLCLGADVLIGFPGEDDAAFAETRDLLAGLPLAYFHVFSYSRRPRTRAAAMPDQVPADVVKKRVNALRELGRRKRLDFFARNLGQVRPALIENTRDHQTGLVRGLTDNYIQVLIPDPAPEPNRIAPVRLERVLSDDRVQARPA